MDTHKSPPRVRKPTRRFTLVMFAAIAALVLIPALLFWPRATSDTVGLYDAERGARSIVYDDKIWAPRGNPVNFPDAQMTVVGETKEGYRLYANQQQGYPGGAAAPASKKPSPMGGST